MGKVNKINKIKSMTGLKSYPDDKGLALASGPDNVPAMIHDQQGNPQGPAMIKQGEIIFSVEAVIAAGEGDYDKGAQMLLALHEHLRELGQQYLQQQSLSGQPPSISA